MNRSTVAMACAILLGCEQPATIQPIVPTPKWFGGDSVLNKLTQQRGQVITYVCLKNAERCIYQVRWADRQKRAIWTNELELTTT